MFAVANVVGTASLALGWDAGAIAGLGVSAAMGVIVAGNLDPSALMTDAPREISKPKPPAHEVPFSVGRLAKAAGAGVMSAAVGAVPGFGYIVGANAAAYNEEKEDRGGLPTLVGLTQLGRLGGAAASVLTMNPLPYVVAVGASAVALGLDNALLTYSDK